MDLWAEVHDGDGPPVLFVHGLLCGSATWALNLPVLSAVCRPVVMQLWGHGGAPTPEEREPFRVGGYVERFERIRAKLGVGQWSVVGQSMGGALALHYAWAHPSAVRGAVFTNAISALAEESFLRTTGMGRLSEGLEGTDGRAVLDDDARNPAGEGKGKRLPLWLRERLVEEWRTHDPIGVGRTCRWTIPELSLRAHLAELQVPTLLVQGMKETNFLPLAAHAATTVPDITVTQLPVGHLVNLHDPDGFNAAVGSFLDRVHQ